LQGELTQTSGTAWTITREEQGGGVSSTEVLLDGADLVMADEDSVAATHEWTFKARARSSSAVFVRDARQSRVRSAEHRARARRAS
jgi:hypothetical protein